MNGSKFVIIIKIPMMGVVILRRFILAIKVEINSYQLLIFKGISSSIATVTIISVIFNSFVIPSATIIIMVRFLFVATLKLQHRYSIIAATIQCFCWLVAVIIILYEDQLIPFWVMAATINSSESRLHFLMIFSH